MLAQHVGRRQAAAHAPRDARHDARAQAAATEATHALQQPGQAGWGRDVEAGALFEFDVNESKEGKLIFEHDEVDVSGLMYSKTRKVLTGVNYTVAKRDVEFFDSWRESIQEKLEKKLEVKTTKRPGNNFRFYLSRNEYEVASINPDCWHLVLVQKQNDEYVILGNIKLIHFIDWIPEDSDDRCRWESVSITIKTESIQKTLP